MRWCCRGRAKRENVFFVLGCACAQQVIFFFFALTTCGPPTHPGCSHTQCTCRSVSVLLLFSLASRTFCGLTSPFRLFCILVFDGQCIVGTWRAALLAPGALHCWRLACCIVGAWRAARTWCACCLGEPRARASVMNKYIFFVSLWSLKFLLKSESLIFLSQSMPFSKFDVLSSLYCVTKRLGLSTLACFVKQHIACPVCVSISSRG